MARTYVPAPTLDVEHQPVGLEIGQGEPIDGDAARAEYDLATATRHGVGTAPADFDGREAWRDLVDLTLEGGEGPLDHLPIQWRDRRLRRLLTLGVVGGGRAAQLNLGGVPLATGLGELGQARRWPEQDRQYARGERVERAGVPHPPLTAQATDTSDDVVGRPAGGLVDIQDADQLSLAWCHRRPPP